MTWFTASARGGAHRIVAACLALSACAYDDGDLDDVGFLCDASHPCRSCVGLPATCGPNHNDDCCANPVVTSSQYFRGNDAEGTTYGTKSYPASVSAFRLDRYEVTVGRFRAFVDAGGGTRARPPRAGSGAHPAIPGSGWDPSWNDNLMADRAELADHCSAKGPVTWTAHPGANEQRPMNCVSWFQAMAFCIWDGGFLPTEAEWNLAAAGTEQRAYPWSSPPASTAIGTDRASYGCQGDGQAGCQVTDLLEVGSKPGGFTYARTPADPPPGHADLAGNVQEWVLDWYRDDGSYPRPCDDCAELDSSTSGRVTRGGSLFNSDAVLRTANRGKAAPTLLDPAYGVRCARRAP